MEVDLVKVDMEDMTLDYEIERHWRMVLEENY